MLQMDAIQGRERENEKEISKTIWGNISDRLRKELGEDLYTSWFANMYPETIEGTCFTVSVPTRFLKNWIESHYLDTVLKITACEIESVDHIVVKVRESATKPATTQSSINHFLHEPGVSGHRDGRNWNGSDLEMTPLPKANTPTSHHLTFSSFVVGESNNMAYSAAKQIAESTVEMPLRFNPLYIHSASGLGKTHLLYAIHHHIKRHRPEVKILYLTAERFMYKFLTALRQKDVISFKDSFESLNLLLIDDFQFLQGKSMLQEFCHRFNTLVDSGRQIVIAGDTPPAKLETIDNRMRSRLAGGLVVDIIAPNLSLKYQILKARVEDARIRNASLNVRDDVIDYIAHNINGNIRELEGALTRIIAYQTVSDRVMTVNETISALRGLIRSSDIRRVRIDDILRVIGRHYNIPRNEILSSRRSHSVVWPRQMGMYLAKNMTTRSLPEIGRRFGGRDHSTVLHAIKKIEEKLKKDARLTNEIFLLKQMIEQE